MTRTAEPRAPQAARADRVVVVGDVMTDVVARTSGPLATASDTPSRISSHGGGSAANTAAWLAAAGVDVLLVGRRGADPFGETAEAALTAAGVRTCLAVDSERPTGTCIVVVHPGGERTLLPDRGANLGLSPADLPVEEFRRGAHLHLSGYLLLDDDSRPAAAAALAMASAAGMTCSVDPSSAAPLRAMGADAFLTATHPATLCLPNLDEAEVLTGARHPATAARAIAATYGEAVVTLGVEGAMWSDGVDLVEVPAVTATVLDSTGAGDAFTAGFLSRWLAGDEPWAALTAGARLAAEAVATLGARPPLDRVRDRAVRMMGG